MELINVKKDQLLMKVKGNRDNHRKVFDDGQEVYRERVIAELDSMLSDAKAGRKIQRAVSLIEPEDHTSDYDRVIAMLEMSVDDQVELNEIDFQRYVMDQWGWNASFQNSTAMYAASNKRNR